MPPNVSITTRFGATITENELKERWDRFIAKRTEIFESLPEETLLAASRELKVPRGSVVEHFKEMSNRGFANYVENDPSHANHVFYKGRFREIHSLSPEGELRETMQYGVQQPKLKAETPDRWVILPGETIDGGRKVVLSKSKLSLNGMLPLFAYHEAIDQKFSSSFDEFWEDPRVLKSYGKLHDGDIYARRRSEQLHSSVHSFLVASFDDPLVSIVPKWIARVNATEGKDLSSEDIAHVVDCVVKLRNGDHGLLPQGIWVASLVSFEDRTKLGDFQDYPRKIKYETYLDWESENEGFIEEWPFESYQLEVLEINLSPNEPEAISIDDGDSYLDFDSNRGRIIGKSSPGMIKKTRRHRWLDELLFPLKNF